ncbi:MAG: hypothetical protein KA715_10105 [Xanthomonadaceae bacterium]|nr:hypothetical protein [Xanthomonadaceae bacterium]
MTPKTLITSGTEAAIQQALSIDPNNGKANFYSAITKPLLTAKGFIPRLEPIADDNQSTELVRLNERISMTGLKELITFATELPEGKKPFDSYYDLQRALRTELLLALVESTKKLERISNGKPIPININLGRLGIKNNSGYNWTYSNSTSDYSEYSYCEKGSYTENKTTKSWEWNCTSTVKVQTYTYTQNNYPSYMNIDASDLKLLSSVTLGAVDYLRLMTAYSAKGLTAFTKRYKAMEERYHMRLPKFWAIELMKKYRDLGILESDHELAEVAHTGEEAMKHFLDLVAMKEQICSSNERWAKFPLFPNICVDERESKHFQIIADLLSGPKKVAIGLDINDELVKVLVDVPGFLSNPPKDIKAVLPELDYSENIISLPDPKWVDCFLKVT